MNTNTFIVQNLESTDTRLDNYCVSQIKGMTRSRLKNSLIQAQINGKNVKLSKKIKNGDIISIQWQNLIPDTIEAENIPLDILFEDEYITIINKAQGMVTHPAAGNWTGTLVHALLWHWNYAQKSTGNLRPGIIHRLDKDTSGVIITAKTPEVEAYFQNRFKSRKVRKIYIAIVRGKMPKTYGTIEINICRDNKNRKRFTTTNISKKGKHSKTAWKVLQTYPHHSLVLFKLYTGRTHQIRVVSKHLGCPILGDPIYNKKDALFPHASLMLHAKSITFMHPHTKNILKITAPLPEHFKNALKTLQKQQHYFAS